MNVEEKLIISNAVGRIALIREGIFVRCYQRSLFAFLPYFPTLKILKRKVKKLDGQVIVYGGIPEAVVAKIFPEAVATEWGYEVLCAEVDEEEYLKWLDAVITKSERNTEGKCNSETVVCAKAGCICNNEEVLNFLQCWQPFAFPIDVNIGFIQSVKKLLFPDEF